MSYLMKTLLASIAVLNMATTEPPYCTITTPSPNILGQETKMVTCCALTATTDFMPPRDEIIYPSDMMVYRTLTAILTGHCISNGGEQDRWLSCWQVMLIE